MIRITRQVVLRIGTRGAAAGSRVEQYTYLSATTLADDGPRADEEHQ